MDAEPAWKVFVNHYVYVPFLGSGLVLGLLLLSYRDLDPLIRTVLVPALALYVIGTSLIGYIYHDLDLRNCVKAAMEKRPPLPQPRIISVLVHSFHAVWFILLAIYLFWKDVL